MSKREPTLKNVLDGAGRRGDHFVSMRAMSGRDMMAVASSGENLAEVIERLGAAVTEHDFTDAEGQPADILDQPWDTLRKLIPVWRLSAEEDALPQA